MKTKKKILVLITVTVVVLLSVFVGVANANNWWMQHDFRFGKVIDAIGFEDGSSLIVSVTNNGNNTAETVHLRYYSRDGVVSYIDAVTLSEPYEIMILQMCGGYIHLTAGYSASVENNLSTAWGERWVIMDDAFLPLGCSDRNIYLPLITK